MEINILILSAGTRNKIVQYFMENLKGRGKVIATDCSKIAPAIYEADQFYIVPRITEESYIDVILDICRDEKINAVLSLIDPELSLIAKNESKFKELGVEIIGSSYEKCELSLDKYNMYCWLVEHGYNCAKTYISKDKFLTDKLAGKIQYPVFIKPRLGSASIAINVVNDDETLEILWSQGDMIIQEFLTGQEIGVDCYIDLLSNKLVSIFAKKKLVMRAGETDKAISFKDEKLFQLVTKFIEEVGYTGQIDIDIFYNDGIYFISEVNPRFGGGYPHAYECGVNHMELIINNLLGKINETVLGCYEENIYMMKYNEIKIIKGE